MVNLSIKSIIVRVEAFAKRAGYSDSYASLKVFNDGKRLDRLRTKNNCTTGLLERADERLTELEAELDAARAAS